MATVLDGHDHAAGVGDHGGDGASAAHGNGQHDHLHPPHGDGKFWKTVAMLVSASLIVAIALGAWGYFSSMSQRIHDLEKEVKSLSETRAEKSDVKHLEEKHSELNDKAALATPVENELDHQRKEIDSLRQSSNNIFSSYNNTIGKFETSINSHEKELGVLRSHVSLLNKTVASHEALLERSSEDDKEIKQLRMGLSDIKERLAKIEAIVSTHNNKGTGKE